MSNEIKNLFKKKKSDNLDSSNLGDFTLNEIKEYADELHIKKNTLSIAKTYDGKRVTAKHVEYPNCITHTLSIIDCLNQKKDYYETIIQMKKDGISAKEISFILGIDISYVYKILKKYKK